MRLSPGIQNFARLRDSGSFVDKTEMIARMLEGRSDLYLFLRPRRFGKSLNLSMMDYYFSLKHAESNAATGRFRGLRITELRPDDPEMNSHPTVMLDMKDLDHRDYGGFLDGVADKMMFLYDSFPEIAGSDRVSPAYGAVYREVLGRTTDENRLCGSLMNLSKMLAAHHGRGTVVLMDEYDYAANLADDPEVRSRILDFMERFVSSAFKGNDSLFLGVVTGVMQVAKESMFSGFNSARVDSVLSTGFDDMYGFTESEVDGICRSMGCAG